MIKDDENKKLIEELKNYIKKHNVIEIESLVHSKVLLDRKIILEKISRESSIVNFPQFKIVNKREEFEDINFPYPFIIKSCESCGSKGSHSMAIIKSKLNQLPENFIFPAIIQEYIVHGSVTFKCYTVFNNIWVKILKNTVSDEIKMKNKNSSFVFNSQKEKEKEKMVEVIQVDRTIENEKNLSSGLLKSLLLKMTEELRNIFQISLIGFDLVLNTKDKKFYVIDVNFFPSFSGLDWNIVFADILSYVNWKTKKK